MFNVTAVNEPLK